MSENDSAEDMVVVARYPSAVEANLAASKLWAYGIEAEVEPHAAYDTLSHLQVGLNPQGIAVLAPAQHQQQARSILRDVKAKATADLDIVPAIQTRCRRALLLVICAMLIIGPLAILTLLHIRKLKNALATEKGRLAEKQYARCAGYLAAATLISFASGVLGFCCIVSVTTTAVLAGK